MLDPRLPRTVMQRLPLCTLALLGACATTTSPAPPTMNIAHDIDSRLARFAPVEIRADLSDLDANERRVLAELVAASKPMGEIFLQQASHLNLGLAGVLAGLQSPAAIAARQLFGVRSDPGTGSTRRTFSASAGLAPRGPASIPTA